MLIDLPVFYSILYIGVPSFQSLFELSANMEEQSSRISLLTSTPAREWTQSSFEQAAEELVQSLERINSDHRPLNALSSWKLKSHSRQGRYLVHENPVIIPLATTFDGEGDADDLEDESILCDEDNIQAHRESGTGSQYNDTLWFLSIVYNHTFGVPVLYFQTQYKNGSQCGRDDIVAYLRQVHQQNRVENSWELISMDQHPISGLPSFFLHPCRTKQRIQSILVDRPKNDGSALLSWLSMMLASLGLGVSPTYYQILRSDMA